MKRFSTHLLESIAKSSGWTPIQHAMAVAHDKHARQIRKFNKERYSMHPKRVRNTVMKFTKDQDVIMAASLHDTVEDTPTTYEELTATFGQRVSDLVKELTHSLKGIKKYGKPEYLLHKMMKMTPEALLIKLADRLDNVSDFPTAPKKFVTRYKAETIYILDNLKRNLTPQHEAIIRQIRKKLV